ncbi:MAG: alpha/beta hydrolase [Acidobacteria bacterium]|nr:alpha/beta hydrolase [Acidobacteriota bacterium]
MKRTYSRVTTCTLALFAALAAGAPAAAQSTDPATRFVEVSDAYQLIPDITYLRAGGVDLKLDLYQARGDGPTPTLIYFHGGGWTNGSKESSALTFLPYLEMGWSVVNVEYRLADVAHAPAAVEDCRCALRWVYRNAEQYNFDLDRIVVTGNSAGGHLALTTGLVTADAGLDRQCPGDRNRSWSTGTTSMAELKVAAIINWYGITDVVGLMKGPPGSSGNFTEAWLGSRTDRAEVAARVSPLTYVRPGIPPVLTIHGAADPIVPYDHAVQLHRALEGARVPNELITIDGGGHGGFNRDENVRIYRAISAFLHQHGLM